MRVLGVNALFHDPSAALVVDRLVVVGAPTVPVPTPATLADQADAAPVVAEDRVDAPRWLTTRGWP